MPRNPFLTLTRVVRQTPALPFYWAGVACNPPGSGLTPERGRFFLGANRAVTPKPTDEANGCNLGHLTPKTL